MKSSVCAQPYTSTPSEAENRTERQATFRQSPSLDSDAARRCVAAVFSFSALAAGENNLQIPPPEKGASVKEISPRLRNKNVRTSAVRKEHNRHTKQRKHTRFPLCANATNLLWRT